MVGLADVSRVAHAMESVLAELRSGRRAPGPAAIDALLVAVDGLTAMVPKLLEGSDQSSLADELVRTLESSDGNGHPPREDAVTPVPVADGSGGGTLAGRELTAETIRIHVDRLDELVRLAGEAAAAELRLERLVTERLGPAAADLAEFRDLFRVLHELHSQTMQARMVPISRITDKLHRVVRDLARTQGKQVQWEVRGGGTELDRAVLEQLADPLLHLVRNAVDHGVESPAERERVGKPARATVSLHAAQVGSEVIVTVRDDGRGIDMGRVRREAARRGSDTSTLTDRDLVDLVFTSGFSMAETVSDVSGRGVGLDVVNTHLRAIHGRIELHSEPGGGTEFRLIVPITLAVLPCLVVEVDRQRYAVPTHSVVAALPVPGHPHRAGGRAVVQSGREMVGLLPLASVLGVLHGGNGQAPTPHRDAGVLVIAGATRKHAFSVDALLGQRDVIVKGLSPLLPRSPLLAGASLEPNGEVLLVLDAGAVIDAARSSSGPPPLPAGTPETSTRQSLLVVDDALTVRELQRSILEQAGYQVRTAADGVEALARLAEQPADLVLTDIEMPRMDGFELLEAIRNQPGRRNVAVLVVTSNESEEHRTRSFELGADGYVVKSQFDAKALLSSVERLLGSTV
jgi:two-component system chemotaxis sensor kinase CheA